MVKNSENSGRKLQKTEDKYRQNEDYDGGENVHALIISRGGLILQIKYARSGGMKKLLIMCVTCVITICGVWMGGGTVRAEGGEIGPGSEVGWAPPEFYIKAVNPGFTNKNVGEMIEIGSVGVGPENMKSLAGVYLSYTKDTEAGSSMLVDFPENGMLASESILVRYAASPESETANLTYRPSVVIGSGRLELRRGEEVIDAVCWGMEGCYKAFDKDKQKFLVRDMMTGEFVSAMEYEAEYHPEGYIVEGKGGGDDGGEAVSDVGTPRCREVEFSEILTYYAETSAEQFVEFYNAGTETVALDGCMVRYKNKEYQLHGMVGPEGYLAWWPTEVSFTKNPTNTNTLELVDADGAVVDKLEYPNGQRKGTAWAFIGYDGAGKEIWRTTYAVTPGEANVYQEYKSCEEGKVINEETGNCVKVTEVAEKTCEVGQYLNPETGRCKKIEVATEVTCKEGYELNPETGRCRKIKENDGADYELAREVYAEETGFNAGWAVAGVAVVGVGYLGWEFRYEIRRLWRKVLRRFRR